MPWWGILFCVVGLLLAFSIVANLIILNGLGQSAKTISVLLQQLQKQMAAVEQRLTQLDGQIADALEEEEEESDSETTVRPGRNFRADAWRQCCTEGDDHDATHYGAQHHFTRLSAAAIDRYLSEIPSCSVEVRVWVSDNDGMPLNGVVLRLNQLISGPEVPAAVDQMLQDEDAQQLFCDPEVCFDADVCRSEMRYGQSGKYVRLVHQGVCADHAHNLNIIVREAPQYN